MQPTLTVPQDASNAETPRKRKRLPISFLLAGIAILGAVLYLVFANTQATAAYDMTVSQLKSCASCSSDAQSVRVTGTVQPGSIVRNDQQQRISFVIDDGKQSLAVAYSGIVPDIFRAGVQVVVEGKYTGQNPFQAQTLLTKCPSKFQSAKPTTN